MTATKDATNPTANPPATRSLTFPTSGSASAELRRMMIEEAQQPVGSMPPRDIDSPTSLIGSESGSASNEETSSEEVVPVETIPETPPVKPKRERATAPQVARATTSAESRATSSAVAHSTSNATHRATLDPVKAAMASVLAAPIAPAPEGGKVQMVTSTIKIRQEVWDRLKYAVQFAGKNQQSLVDEALCDLFQKLARQGDGE